MTFLSSNPGLRVEIDRLESQFRKLCRTPKMESDPSPGNDEVMLFEKDDKKPFGFMYNLFFWAVAVGALNGDPLPLSGKTDVPFRWAQIPVDVQRRLLAIALTFLMRSSDPENERQAAEELLLLPPDDLSERVRVVLEQLANRGLSVMEMEVEIDRPDAYRSIDNLVDTVMRYSESAR